MKRRFNRVAVVLVFSLLFGGLFCSLVKADSIRNGLTMAPMEQEMVLNAGESRESSFNIANPSVATSDIYYELSVEPFYVNEAGSVIFESEGDSGEIVDWITFNVPTVGKIVPNENKEISFTIDVPESAPAGGQYAAVFVTMKDSPSKDDDGSSSNDEEKTKTGINEIRRLGHLIYAEVAGTTVRKGEIAEISVPSFLLSGDIKGTSMVINQGNVHGDAKYTLQVFPAFSNEEVFSNEEKPEERVILPNRKMYSETVWDKTPSIGIFNVVYRVEFEGSVAEVSKMVIVCPLWLLFVILLAIMLIITWLVVKAKSSKKSSRSE